MACSLASASALPSAAPSSTPQATIASAGQAWVGNNNGQNVADSAQPWTGNGQAWPWPTPGIPCIQPTNYSSRINILDASRYLERARWSKNQEQMLGHLKKARKHLSYAQSNFENDGVPLHNQMLIIIIKEFDDLHARGQSISKSKLPLYQQEDLYGFQGVMAACHGYLSQ